MRRDAPRYNAEFSGPQDWNLRAAHDSVAWPVLRRRRAEDELLAGQLLINHEVVALAAEAGHPDAIKYLPVLLGIIKDKDPEDLEIAS